MLSVVMLSVIMLSVVAPFKDDLRFDNLLVLSLIVANGTLKKSF
jgi:hypothetical protein